METLGRYTLERRVGAGGMAEVWKARVQGPSGFQKVVAIKKVLPDLVADLEFIDMFVDEAKLVARLVHPNIVQVFDFGEASARVPGAPPAYFIAMEYVSGQNLASFLRRLRERGLKMPLDIALYIIAEAAKGLAYAHAEKDDAGQPLTIVHRDISPHNLLLSYKGEVKVTDFGIAKVASAIPRTATGVFRGKVSYVSPEQARLRPLDNRSDIFSLGIVMFELLTQQRLFSGRSGEEIVSRVMDFSPPTPNSMPDVPGAVTQILNHALQPDPDLRFQDATEMELSIMEILGPRGVVTARNSLSSLIQSMFEEEMNSESTGETSDGAGKRIPSIAPLETSAAMLARGSGASSAASGGMEVVGNSEMIAHTAQPSSRSFPDLVGNETPPPGHTETWWRSRLGVQSAGSGRSQRVMDISHHSLSSSHVVRPARQDRNTATGVMLALAAAAVVATGILGVRMYSRPSVTAIPTPIVAISVPARSETQNTKAIKPAEPARSQPAARTTRAPSAAVAPPPSRNAGSTTATQTQAIASAPPTKTAVRGFGLLTVLANPWVYVMINGKVVGEETPFKDYRLAAGTYTLRVGNPALQWHKDLVGVSITAGKTTEIYVDVKADKVSTSSR